MSVISFQDSTSETTLNVNTDHVVLWYFEDDRLHITPSTGMGKLTSAVLTGPQQVALHAALNFALGG